MSLAGSAVRERLGVGRSTLKKSSAAKVRDIVTSMLDDQSLRSRAREVGVEARQRDGAVVAADLIENLGWACLPIGRRQ